MLMRCCMLVLLGVMMVSVVGCAENKLTRQNFDTIYEGKSNKTEVEMTMGDKYIDRGDHWEYEDMDRSLSVMFHFDEKGKVLRKEWRDAKTGEWDGAAPHMNEDVEGRKVNDQSGNMTIHKD